LSQARGIDNGFIGSTIPEVVSMSIDDISYFGFQGISIKDIRDPEADPGRFIGVGGADPSFGSVDSSFAAAGIAKTVGDLVNRQDHVGCEIDKDPALSGNAPLLEFRYLALQDFRVTGHTRSDKT